ncbi:MAG: 2Fe-2S iron-sulfur cluster-binding protein [Sinimarinibacterium flocculans]|uniref:2Fe-2S iron-sulfur cluster-binding protein n=1 Tax=Sinimarinibacterium flocculans TaxID=985250 RepID=UPI003C5DD63D
MNQHKITIDGADGVSFAQCEGDTVLRAALRAGLGFPYECNSGGCGSCKFDLVSGEVDNLWPDAPGLTERDRRKQRLLACQCRAKGPVSVRVRLGEEYQPQVPPRRQIARLIETIDVTSDIREFRFRTPVPATFLPGQYAMLDIPGVAQPRAYSMSNLGNEDGDWHFQIRLVPNGRATAQLFGQLRVGDEIGIDGPYGLAWLRPESPRHIACIAGGSGLAPMVSIARGAAAAGILGEGRELHFFYGGRTPKDICGEVFLQALPGYAKHIHYHPVVSIAEAAGEAWGGATGFVHDHVRNTIGDRMAEFEFYFAGPPPMTQALQDLLMVQHRVPYTQIHYDRFF